MVKPSLPEAQENKNGIIIPDNVEEEQKAQGEVLATGDGVNDIVAGDKVIYGVFAGEVLKVKEGNKEVEYKLIHEEDIIAFLK